MGPLIWFSIGQELSSGAEEIHELIMDHSTKHIIEVDIRDFYDNVKHEMLIEFIRIRITDATLLNPIGRFPKVGYVNVGVLLLLGKSTPQGTVLSSILANIFLRA